MQTIIQILMLSDNIFFDFRGSSIRLQDCGDWVLEEEFLTFKKRLLQNNHEEELLDLIFGGAGGKCLY